MRRKTGLDRAREAYAVNAISLRQYEEIAQRWVSQGESEVVRAKIARPQTVVTYTFQWAWWSLICVIVPLTLLPLPIVVGHYLLRGEFPVLKIAASMMIACGAGLILSFVGLLWRILWLKDKRRI